MKNLFRFDMNQNISTTICSGLIMITLSTMMNLFPENEFINILLRDVLMILLLGFAFPLYYIQIKYKSKLSVIGIHTSNLKKSIIINIIASVILGLIFICNSTNPIILSKETLLSLIHI